MFPGSHDQETAVTNAFVVPMLASSVRITPYSYVGIALRLELYGYGPLNEIIASMNHDVQLGCTPPVFGEGLGVEDGRIPDSSLTYSSNPYGGRLNALGLDGVTGGVWYAITSDPNKWVKPNLPTLCFFNISHGREMSARDGSYFNDPEASFVVFLISSMMEMGISPSDVGVITLYKAQVSRIRMLLQTASTQNSSELKAIQILTVDVFQGGIDTQNSSELKAIQISTVDAFQGGEKSIIILSCVRTQRVGFIDSDKRTNVALTRSKNHLLIVGGMKMLSDNQLWGEIVHKCQERSDGIQDSKAFQKQWEERLRELKQDADLEPAERPKRTRGKRRKLERSEREHSPAMSLDSNDEDFVSSVSPSVPGTSNACKPTVLEMDCSKKTLLHPTGSPISSIGDDDLPCIDLSTPPEDERLSNARLKMDCMASPRSREVVSATIPVAFQVDNTTYSPHPYSEGHDLPLVNLDTVPKDKDIGDAKRGANHEESSDSEGVVSQGMRDPLVQEPSEMPDASISYSPLEHVVDSDSEESDEDLPNFNIGNIL
eukprot:XP_011672709.1 PREDICTED: uncharacterized protein LOC762659 [Strongylocentrotus purpuratus]